MVIANNGLQFGNEEYVNEYSFKFHFVLFLALVGGVLNSIPPPPSSKLTVPVLGHPFYNPLGPVRQLNKIAPPSLLFRSVSVTLVGDQGIIHSYPAPSHLITVNPAKDHK